MSEKSWVSLEAAICPVCGKEHETGTLLLDKRMKESMERTTLTGYAMCPEHQKLKDDGFIALIGVDEERCTYESSGNLTMKGAHRTGDLIHIRSTVWDYFFEGKPIPPHGMCFVDKEIITMLKVHAGHAERDEGEPT